MPVADRLRDSSTLPSLIGIALSLELFVAVGVLAGPLRPASPAAATALAPPPASAPKAALPRVSAPGLWSGAVAATALQVQRDGALQVPARADQLGWWAGGVRPGELGAAVLVGHADLDGRLGVFTRLDEAKPGMQVVVAVGSQTVRYRITSVGRYAKKAFPTALVYRPSATAVLRLVTCGGVFDGRTGAYRDNVVVQAVRV